MSILTISINLFCLLTPFFVLSLFLDVCKDKTLKEKRKIAIKTSLNIFGICILILWCGNAVFSILGITLLAFQIGSGIILFLSGLSMMSSTNVKNRIINQSDEDPSLIPLTLPITVGPGTIGALMVLSSSHLSISSLILASIGLFIAVFLIFLLLYFANICENILKKNGLTLLSKLTGLFLAILAIQAILNGVTTFINIFLK